MQVEFEQDSQKGDNYVHFTHLLEEVLRKQSLWHYRHTPNSVHLEQ